MTIAQSFATYLATVTGSTLGQTLFIGSAPSSNQVTDAIWWIVASGGAPETRLHSGETLKRYQIDVYYRDRDASIIDQKMFALEEDLNCSGCVTLSGFDLIDVASLSFPADIDLDDEDRKIMLLQVSLLTYKSC